MKNQNICLLFYVPYVTITLENESMFGRQHMAYGKITEKQSQILEYIKSEILNY